MRDCRARHGILVCPNGYTAAALRRAQDAITIRLVPLEDLEHFDPRQRDPCLGSCTEAEARKDGPGLVMFDSPYGLATGTSPLSIMAVGKCDVCHDFHVWCWDCGRKFSLGNKNEAKCDCDRFWVTATEEDEVGGAVMAVHIFLVLPSGLVLLVDRRRLG